MHNADNRTLHHNEDLSQEIETINDDSRKLHAVSSLELVCMPDFWKYKFDILVIFEVHLVKTGILNAIAGQNYCLISIPNW